MKKVSSFLLGFFIAALAVAPGITFNIPVIVNSIAWRYMVILAGLLGFLLLFQNTRSNLKVLIIYLFATCFLSQVPYISFNAYVLIVATLYFFLWAKSADYEYVFKFIEAAFWLEVALITMQHFGADTLLMFDNTDFEKLFHGTALQPMRLGSLLAIMSPFLLVRNKWYMVPLLILSVMSHTLGFSLALVAGAVTYSFFKYRQVFVGFLLVMVPFVIYVCLSNDHIHAELTWGRWPVWGLIIQTWAFDTMRNFHGFTGAASALNPSPQAGPFSMKYFLFGHGIDTFLQLFPFYKYDPNPFGQAHNDWLQLLWETGLIGFIIFIDYCAKLLSELHQKKEIVLIAGLAIIAFNMFFAFPWRMTQTVLLMVTFVAWCEKKLEAK